MSLGLKCGRGRREDSTLRWICERFACSDVRGNGMTDEESKKSKIYCNWCKQETNHELKGEHTIKFPHENFPEMLVYRFWICMGCERGTLQEGYWNGGMNEDDEEQEYFPERSKKFLVPKPYFKLKIALSDIYHEAITCYNACYNSKTPILCAAGLRALLEGICQDKRIKGKNLKVKIEGLKTRLPNKNIIRNLHHFRFMGNDAVHELTAPKSNELALAIGVIEDLLNFFYELAYKASQLREMRRSKKPKTLKPGKAVSATLTFTADT
jgi:Domain of unknown function (DUF4145)